MAATRDYRRGMIVGLALAQSAAEEMADGMEDGLLEAQSGVDAARMLAKLFRDMKAQVAPETAE